MTLAATDSGLIVATATDQAATNTTASDAPPPASAQTYQQAILSTAGVAAYWPLTELVAGNLADLGPHNLSLPYTGRAAGTGIAASAPPTAKLAGGINFDGVDDQATRAIDDDALDARLGSWSFEVWIRSTDAVATIWRKNDGGANGLAVNLVSATQMRFAIHNTLTLTVVSGAQDGNWHHIAAVLDRATGKARLFRDGAQLGADLNVASVAAVDLNSAANGGLGNLSGNAYAGDMAHAAIYLTALDAATIAARYQLGVNGPATLGQLKFCASDAAVP